jgi:hypothetical protein
MNITAIGGASVTLIVTVAHHVLDAINGSNHRLRVFHLLILLHQRIILTLEEELQLLYTRKITSK